MGDYARYNLMLRIYKCSLNQEKKRLCIFPVKPSHLLWINLKYYCQQLT